MKSAIAPMMHGCDVSAFSKIVYEVCADDGSFHPDLSHTAACREVWEFLSAWSELYGITADAGFLRSVSQKIQGANNSVRR